MNSQEQEIENRIAEMEQKDTIFPKAMNAGDYLAVILVSIFCLIAIILGGSLS